MEETQLDPQVVNKLESSLPPKVKDLLRYLRSIRSVTLHDAHKDARGSPVKIYTDNLANESRIWLSVDYEYLEDSLIHEIGQVYKSVLGYPKVYPKKATTSLMQKWNIVYAAYSNNAFSGVIAEWMLEKYGIDRTFYKQKAKKRFEDLLKREVAPPNHPNHLKIKEPSKLATVCIVYLQTRLLLGEKAFESLQTLWEETIKVPEVTKAAKDIIAEATQEEITPSRYDYLVRFFAKTLGFGDVIA